MVIATPPSSVLPAKRGRTCRCATRCRRRGLRDLVTRYSGPVATTMRECGGRDTRLEPTVMRSALICSSNHLAVAMVPHVAGGRLKWLIVIGSSGLRASRVDGGWCALDVAVGPLFECDRVAELELVHRFRARNAPFTVNRRKLRPSLNWLLVFVPVVSERAPRTAIVEAG